MDDRQLNRFVRALKFQGSIAGTQSSDALARRGLPTELGLQLTHRCNLRCKECFQWGENGNFKTMFPADLQDLSLGIIENLLQETACTKSALYLWGGEPLLYAHWDALSELLIHAKRHVVLCTNGIGLCKKLPSICSFSDDLVIMISVDGLEKTNDELRGLNTFKQIMRSISALVQARMKGKYYGDIAVSCVITDQNLHELDEFVDFFANVGVDSVYLVFPWFISKATAEEMDEYYGSKIASFQPFPRLTAADSKPSWHHFTYHLKTDSTDSVISLMERMRGRRKAPRVRFQPALSTEEVDIMISGSGRPVQGRKRCLSKFSRLSVMPNGDVTTCKMFPEFTVGNLSRNSLQEIWNGQHMKSILTRLDEGLAPVCGKCVQLYLGGENKIGGF